MSNENIITDPATLGRLMKMLREITLGSADDTKEPPFGDADGLTEFFDSLNVEAGAMTAFLLQWSKLHLDRAYKRAIDGTGTEELQEMLEESESYKDLGVESPEELRRIFDVIYVMLDGLMLGTALRLGAELDEATEDWTNEEREGFYDMLREKIEEEEEGGS